MKRYWFETYGCQMNKAESDSLELLLKKHGWGSALSEKSADLIIINTCSVRKTAEERIWGRIGYYKKLKEKQSFKLVVIGCMAERIGKGLYDFCPGTVDLVLGTFEKNDLMGYLDGIGKSDGKTDKKKERSYIFPEYHSDGSSFKAFVPIMHGCDNFCSYCIVPYVRGREVSRSTDDVLKEVRFLESRNVKEITFLGQNVNSYRSEKEGKVVDFGSLLKLADRLCGSVGWIRFFSSHPKDFTSELIDVIAGCSRVCRHIHLPMQHGSDKILELMNRKYSSSRYLEIVSEIREKIPGVSLTTDILIGFPGESEKDFEETAELMKKIRFADAYTYYYNPREGTKAFTMPDSVPQEIKLERLERIIELQREISAEEKKKKVGTTVKVLAESISKRDPNELLGRTEGNEMIVFPEKCDKIGKFLDVKIISCYGNTFKGAV